MKFIILRNFVYPSFCNKVITEFKSVRDSVKLNLPNDTDLGNIIYESKRSKGLSYKYIIGFNDKVIKDRLKDALNLDFSDSITKKCLPVFYYTEGGYIKAHRGTKKELGINEYQEYVAMLQLTQRGVDYEGGRFYLNDKATASEDGKTVYNDKEEDRFYPMLDKGDLIIFHNPSLVHAVTPVEGENSFRATCSWRTNQKQ